MLCKRTAAWVCGTGWLYFFARIFSRWHVSYYLEHEEFDVEHDQQAESPWTIPIGIIHAHSVSLSLSLAVGVACHIPQQIASMRDPFSGVGCVFLGEECVGILLSLAGLISLLYIMYMYAVVYQCRICSMDCCMVFQSLSLCVECAVLNSPPMP